MFIYRFSNIFQEALVKLAGWVVVATKKAI